MVCDNMLLKNVEVVLNWTVGRSWKNFEAHYRKCLDHFKKPAGKNMDVEGPSG